MDENILVADGVLPGLLQSIDVAELFAVLVALTWALRFQLCICIHSDSSFAVDGLGYQPYLK